MRKYKTVSKVPSDGKFLLTLKDVFEEYKGTIASVTEAANMPLPNISFVFYDADPEKVDAVYFVSPSMLKITHGDIPGALSELIQDYPDTKYRLKFMLAVFPGVVFRNNVEQHEFKVYGGMDFENKAMLIDIDPTSLDSIEDMAQREAISGLLSSLRNEYIVQKSMEKLNI